MRRTRISFYIGLTFLAFIVWMFSDSNQGNDNFSEVVKISMRDVGHQLLLANQDSTSLVLIIIALDKAKYKLSFQQQLSFEPGSLVSLVKENFKKNITS